MSYLRCFPSKSEKFFTRAPFHPFVLSAESHNRAVSSKLRLPFLSEICISTIGMDMNFFLRKTFIICFYGKCEMCARDRYFRLNLDLGLRGFNSLESGGGFLLIAFFFFALCFYSSRRQTLMD